MAIQVSWAGLAQPTERPSSCSALLAGEMPASDGLFYCIVSVDGTLTNQRFYLMKC